MRSNPCLTNKIPFRAIYRLVNNTLTFSPPQKTKNRLETQLEWRPDAITAGQRFEKIQTWQEGREAPKICENQVTCPASFPGLKTTPSFTEAAGQTTCTPINRTEQAHIFAADIYHTKSKHVSRTCMRRKSGLWLRMNNGTNSDGWPECRWCRMAVESTCVRKS